MCGIFGIFGQFESDTFREETLHAIGELNHRGPDAWGLYSAPNISLGHVRLSIVDVSHGHQPMVGEGFVISFNGEIYNHIELRAELEAKGIKFETKSDTEVILKMYESEGVSCFSKFNGQFAILLWDSRSNRLIVGRDRYGIRPLYVLEFEGRHYFSSEMKAFDPIPGFKREFEPQNLFEHALLWNTLQDSTIYKGIRSVEAGTFEIYRLESDKKIVRYFEVGQDFDPSKTVPSFEDSLHEFKGALQKSVALRLRSDVPVGAYLSGGIDSTVISHEINEITGHEFNTFSVAFSDQDYDESTYQQMASEQIGSTHHTVTISRQDVNEHLLKVAYHCERPIFRTAPVPLHLLAKDVTNNNIKVVLTGEGADEILFGYDTFKELKILDAWSKRGESDDVTESIKKLYPHLAHYADSKQFGLMKIYYEGFLSEYDNLLGGLNIRISNNKIISGFFNKDWGLSFDKDRLIDRVREMLPHNFSEWSLLQKNTFLELKTLLPGYLLSSQGDRMALSFGVEGRFPFLDHHVVELAFSLPDDFKLKGFDQKHILKEAYKESIPKEILDRPKRPYMAPDLVSFFHEDGTMTELVKELLSEDKINEYQIFDYKMVSRFLRKFSRGIPDNIGYRDNMIFVFLLTTQCCKYWIENWVPKLPDASKCMVDIVN